MNCLILYSNFLKWVPQIVYIYKTWIHPLPTSRPIYHASAIQERRASNSACSRKVSPSSPCVVPISQVPGFLMHTLGTVFACLIWAFLFWTWKPCLWLAFNGNQNRTLIRTFKRTNKIGISKDTGLTVKVVGKSPTLECEMTIHYPYDLEQGHLTSLSLSFLIYKRN